MHTIIMKPTTTLAGAIGKAAQRFLRPASPTRGQQRVMRHLASLDEYLLSDIGISRDEIRDVVVGGAVPARRWLGA
jgi:uncharacterized protein YjiS (DUF1127 family)